MKVINLNYLILFVKCSDQLKFEVIKIKHKYIKTQNIYSTKFIIKLNILTNLKNN